MEKIKLQIHAQTKSQYYSSQRVYILRDGHEGTQQTISPLEAMASLRQPLDVDSYRDPYPASLPVSKQLSQTPIHATKDQIY